MTKTIGKCEGDTCNRNGCHGVIGLDPVENCSCHISPPCAACTSPRHFCPVCHWQESEDQIINDYIVNVKPSGEYRMFGLRELDKTKVDWHSHSHTNSSMIKRGVYPEGTTQAAVRKLVDGTFGGRFNSFGNGEFEFVAYTD